VIKTFRHKGLEAFFRTGSKGGIQPHHAGKLRVQLTTLDSARCPGDMNASWMAPASAQLMIWRDTGPVWVSGNWRLTFTFDQSDVVLVDYQDYH
jgi:proteic killer suppression protein